MRIQRRFTVPELQAAAEIGYSNALRYLRRLEAAGYVRKAREHAPGRTASFTLWLLVHDTGPQAPIPQRDGTVWDPNRERYHVPSSSAARPRVAHERGPLRGS